MFLPRPPPEWEAAGKAVAVATAAKVLMSTQPLAGYILLSTEGAGVPIIRGAAVASAVHVIVHFHVQVQVQLEAGTGSGADTGGGTGGYTGGTCTRKVYVQAQLKVQVQLKLQVQT